MKKLNKKGKKILLSITAVLLVAAIGVGIWFGSRGSGDPVAVYPFDYLGMTEFWGDSQESYGPVTTDRIQTVFLTDTQTVTEVKVKEGDTVKKGDILLSFDTTLSDLQLERKRLETEKFKLQVEEAEKELKKIQGMVPMEPYTPDFGIPEFTEPQGEPVGDMTLYIGDGHTGKSQESAFITWIRDDTVIDNTSLLQQIHGTLGLPELCGHLQVIQECPLCQDCPHGIPRSQCDICNPEICECGRIKEFCPDHGTCQHGFLIKDCPACNAAVCEHGFVEDACPYCNPPQCIHGADCEICYPPIPDPGDDGQEGGGQGGTTTPGGGTTNPDPPVPTPPNPENPDPNSLSASSQDYRVIFLSSTEDGGETEAPNGCGHYIIFKMTQGNTTLSPTVFWQGVYLYHQNGRLYTKFFTPAIEDYTIPEQEEEEVEVPSYDFSIGYTAKELSEMRKEQEKKIKELEFKLKMATAEYKIMQKELSDGNIYADFDGEVVSLLTEEESREQKQPFVKVSGGGGFYIEGSVSELEKANLKPGQEVTVNDWSSGGTYTGTVKSIGDFPSSDDNWSGMGNPNATFYPFTAFVDGEANLQAGSYVSIQYSTSGETNGIYLEKAFVRTENGQSYVFALGSDGRLEKRNITTGKSLWGSYLEILSGLTPEDKLAFPYGKNVKDGAKAEEQDDISSLYMY